MHDFTSRHIELLDSLMPFEPRAGIAAKKKRNSLGQRLGDADFFELVISARLSADCSLEGDRELSKFRGVAGWERRLAKPRQRLPHLPFNLRRIVGKIDLLDRFQFLCRVIR